MPYLHAVSFVLARADNVIGQIVRKVIGGPPLAIVTGITSSVTKTVDNAVTSVKKGIEKKV